MAWFCLVLAKEAHPVPPLSRRGACPFLPTRPTAARLPGAGACRPCL